MSHHGTHEQTYHAADGVVVTNKRVVIDSTTYALANITSVGVGVIGGGRSGWGGLIVISFFLSVIGLLSGQPISILGIFLLVVSIIVFHAKRPRHALVMRTASGEENVLVGEKPDRIRQIAGAITRAIVSR